MVIGVYGRSDPTDLKQLIESGQVAWPCIRNSSSDVPPSSSWGVAKWPANFVIDKNGFVRCVNSFDEDELSKTIDALITEDEKAVRKNGSL